MDLLRRRRRLPRQLQPRLTGRAKWYWLLALTIIMPATAWYISWNLLKIFVPLALVMLLYYGIAKGIKSGWDRWRRW